MSEYQKDKLVSLSSSLIHVFSLGRVKCSSSEEKKRTYNYTTYSDILQGFSMGNPPSDVLFSSRKSAYGELLPVAFILVRRIAVLHCKVVTPSHWPRGFTNWAVIGGNILEGSRSFSVSLFHHDTYKWWVMIIEAYYGEMWEMVEGEKGEGKRDPWVISHCSLVGEGMGWNWFYSWGRMGLIDFMGCYEAMIL